MSNEKKLVQTRLATSMSGKKDQDKQQMKTRLQSGSLMEIPDTSLSESSLSTIQLDLDEIKQSLKGSISKADFISAIADLVKKDDLTEIVSTIVRKLLENVKEDLRKEIAVESERVVKERTGELMDRVESLEFENHQLREKLQEAKIDNDKMKSDMKEYGRRSKQASAASNQMEQFSRKLNVKVLGLEEEENEILREKIPKVVKEVTKYNLDNRDIVAIHRIPGRQGQPRPVIVKFWSLDCKLLIIKKRKDFKQSKGIRLVEDVTRMNTELINKLLRHQEIDSAWYFNGFVYGKTKSGKRIKFDIYDDIDGKIRV